LPLLDDRASGVLLHPTSLPGRHGSGDLGDEARRFADFLASAGQRWWQMLPVGPVGYGNSPYSAQSSFAGNPTLIALEPLVEEGLLEASALGGRIFPERRVDFGAVVPFREERLRMAFAALPARGKPRSRLDAFKDESRGWLPDFALFRALKRAHGETAWAQWEPDLKRRRRPALETARKELAAEIAFHEFEQYEFARQWRALRKHCRSLGIALMGDIPIFVAHDSADVWANQELFHLDEDGMPAVVAGVPPDYFSKTGQLWGNPLYRWPRLKKSGYAWWVARVGATLERFDAIRLDHFIGFHRYWEIARDSPTAERGRYVRGPGASIFRALRKALGALPLVAEDLGVVTPEVKALRDRFHLPGIRLLQFAFGDDPCAPDFLPHNYPRRCVVYTGTHDNDTTVGWFNERGGAESTRSQTQVERERDAALAYLGSDGTEIHWDMIRMVLLSVADLAIVPVQDLLGLGTEARMNRPGTLEGNWEWRFASGALDERIGARLGELTRTYGRWPEATE